MIKSGVPCFFTFCSFKKIKIKMAMFLFSFLLIHLVPTSKVIILMISLITIRLHLCMTSTIRAIMPKKEGEEDCDLLELARLLRQEERVIQPHEERFKIDIPGKVRK